ncbi:MAG: alpha/beta fold hydrolase [Burkholderiales bacterium]
MNISFHAASTSFVSHGTRCGADLYLPDVKEAPPVVVMAHGFGAERRFRLPAYAERFAAAGLAVLLFDYRSFGDSDGQPRQLVDPWRHVQDWQAAIAHARALREIDGTRVGLFGSSYSGGHVLAIAAQDPAVRAVVSQVPYVDPFTTMWQLGPLFALRAIPHGLLDTAKALLGLPPHYVPIVSDRGELAMLPTPDAYEGVMRIRPADSNWQNKCCARIALKFSLYRPASVAGRVRCPALLMLAERDLLISPHAVARVAARMPRAELARFDCGHFDIYHDRIFEQAVSRQTAFFLAHLTGVVA